MVDDYKIQKKNSINYLLYANINNAVLFLFVDLDKYIYNIRPPPRVLL